MKRVITQSELRNDLPGVLRDVLAGQTVTVTRNGVPVAELRPLSSRRFVPRGALAAAARNAPRIEFARLRADLDAVVDPVIGG